MPIEDIDAHGNTPVEIMGRTRQTRVIGANGHLDDLPLNRVHDFEGELLEHFRSSKKQLRQKLAEARSFKGLEDEFNEAVKAFKTTWAAG